MEVVLALLEEGSTIPFIARYRKDKTGALDEVQALMEEARRTRALEWVAGTEMTSGEMAERLGFSDVRGFRRAFKRWTNMSLQQYRTERARA